MIFWNHLNNINICIYMNIDSFIFSFTCIVLIYLFFLQYEYNVSHIWSAFASLLDCHKSCPQSFAPHTHWHPPCGRSPSTQAGGAFFHRDANCARVKMGRSSALTLGAGHTWYVHYTSLRCVLAMSLPWSPSCCSWFLRKGSTR